MFKRQRKLLEAAASAQLIQPVNQALTTSPWSDPEALQRLTIKEVFGDAASLITGTVSRQDAMKIPAVARARNLICGQVAHLPLVAYRGSQRLTQQPKIMQQLEPGRPQSVSLAWIVDALIFEGMAFLEITSFDSEGKPAEFRVVPAWHAQHKDGDLESVNGRKVHPGQWLRIDSPQQGILATGSQLLADMLQLDESTRKVIAAPLPNIELHQTGGAPLSSDEIDQLISGWVTARRGRNGGVGYTNQSVEARVLEQPVENLLIQARNDFALQIARLLNLPAWAVDAQTSGSSLTYSNVPSRTRELIDYTLTPYMDAIAGRLSLDDVLPRGQWCKFDTSQILQGSFSDRMTAYKTAIDAGIYTPEDVRQLEAGNTLEE